MSATPDSPPESGGGSCRVESRQSAPDWLCALVFGRVHDLWDEANRFAEQVTEQNRPQVPQPPLDALLVYQCGEANLPKAFCRLPVLQQWAFDGKTFAPGNAEKASDGNGASNRRQKRASHPFVALPTSPETRGALFAEGMVWFYITPDRKRVLFTCRVGPRFGRGILYAVEGQGQSGRLTRERLCWIS